MIDSDNVEISDLNKNITDDLLTQLFTDNIENSNFDTGQSQVLETNDEDIKFAEVAKNSLSDALKIDQSSQVDFEIYLADFLLHF